MPDFKKELSRVEIVALSYYSRKEIQKAIFEFCKNRETVGNYNNKFFGKRPDVLDYPSDIPNIVKQGATSFHCSEEIWSNPMEIHTEMKQEDYNSLRIGWDFLIDIDTKFLDYAKIAAKILIKELERHGVRNYGIKFSGSRGFHIIIPSKAFPESVGEDLTKNKFPEWPKLIAGYLLSRIKEPMNQEILRLSGREKLEEKGELESVSLCPRCKNKTEKRLIGKYQCLDAKCKAEVESMKSNRKQMLCPSCNGRMNRVNEREISFCVTCKINTANIEGSVSSYGGIKRENQIEFETKDTIKSTEDSVDLALAVSRHLFRAPYSLHEKTTFASIVLEKGDIENFKPSDADPLKISEVKPYIKPCIPGEAKELLLQALDWGKENAPKEKTKKYEGEALDLSGLTFTEEMFPKVIKEILKGIKADGRKRALSLLLSFYTSLGFPSDYIEEKIFEWNKKNYHPLKEGYIKSQVSWHLKNKRLPPNYGNQVYKLFGFENPEEPGMKNPINYTIKLAMKEKAKKSK